MTRNGEFPSASKSALPASIRVLEVLRKTGPLTRRELCEQTGYSRATISQVTNLLIDSGTLAAVDEQQPNRGARARGRPSAKIQFHPLRAAQAGLEIGCARIAFALCDNAGLLILSGSAPVSPQSQLSERAECLVGMVLEKAAEAGIDLGRLTRSVLGLLRSEIFEPHRPPLHDAASLVPDPGAESARRTIEIGLRAPVSIGNNMSMRALAEARHFRDEAANLLFVRADHGIGGGLVLGGALQPGNQGLAGNLGHVTADPRGARCECGNRGCVEHFASMSALLKLSGEAAQSELSEAIRSGRHADLIARAIQALATATAIAVTLLDPGTLVLGGNVLQLPGFFESTVVAVRESVPESIRESLAIEPAAADQLSGAIGAMNLAFQSEHGLL